MSLIVLDIECNKNKRVGELVVYEGRKTVEYSFFSLKKFKATCQSNYCIKHFRGINWSSGYI